MKTIYAGLSPKVQRVALGLICLALLGVGWQTKMSVDRVAAIDDQVAAGFGWPSQVYLWGQWKANQARKNRSIELSVPVAPGTNRPAIPAGAAKQGFVKD